MPLSAKGKEVLASMEKTYGSKKKAEEVMYAMKNLGELTGIDNARKDMTDNEWETLIKLLDKFFGEESEEKEHKEDSAFSELEAKFKKEGKKDPGGLAYAIGEKKYGKEGMEKKSLAGRKDANTTYIDRKLAHVDAICDSVMSHK